MQKTSSRARRGATAVGGGVLAAAAIAVPAQAATQNFPGPGIGNVHGPVVERYGFFPEYYQAQDGTRLQLCIDLAATCGAVATPGPGPISFPDNFPDELFYWSASASAAGVNLTLAQEATFDGADGSQGSFGRVRIKSGPGNALTAGQWYRFTTPYGQWDLQAGAAGVNDTRDDGCGPAIGGPCTTDAAFAATSASVIGPNFLTATNAPAGFLGDAASNSTVTGSAFTPPLGSVDASAPAGVANYFRVDHIAADGGAVLGPVGASDQFVVQGKLADVPALPQLLTTSGSAGNQPIAAGAKPLTVTVRNGGAGGLNIGTPSVVAGSDFSMTATTCANQALASAPRFPGTTQQTCTVTIAFDPSTTGTRTGTLNVPEQGGAPHSIALTGVGTTGALAPSPSALSFGDQLVGSSAPTRTITITNGGGAATPVGAVTVTGANAGDFQATGCSGQNLDPNATCQVQVLFTPGGAGVRTATVNVPSPSGNVSIPVSGTGTEAPKPIVITLGGGNAGAIPPANTTPPTVAAGPLRVTMLSISKKIKRSKVRRSGLRLATRLSDGTQVIRIRVYRKKRNGSKALLAQGYRTISTGGLYRTTLKDPKFRRDLTTGSYELDVTPGRSRTDLGTPAKYAFKVVK